MALPDSARCCSPSARRLVLLCYFLDSWCTVYGV